MRVFKPKYNNNGKNVKTKKWYLDFTDHLNRRHKMAAFSTKSQSEGLGRQIETLISCKIAGQSPNSDQQRWLDGISNSWRQKIVKIGLLDSRRAAAGKPLSKHLEDFQKSLLSRGNTPDYVETVIARVKRVFDECKFTQNHLK